MLTAYWGGICLIRLRLRKIGRGRTGFIVQIWTQPFGQCKFVRDMDLYAESVHPKTERKHPFQLFCILNPVNTLSLQFFKRMHSPTITSRYVFVIHLPLFKLMPSQRLQGFYRIRNVVFCSLDRLRDIRNDLRA